MSEKNSKEFGTELCHGRNFETLSHTNTHTSSHGSKRGQKFKANSKDKRAHQQVPRNGQYNSHTHPSSQYKLHTQRDGVRKRDGKPSLSTYEEGLYESVSHSGKKKASSLNHLLNFTIASTDRRGSSAPLPIIGRRKRLGHSFNKEQFLQANCQFVVSTSGDYQVHSADPDLLVDWEHIEQVRLFCHQIPSCPICLYPPRAAKITRCGHVYCWSCVLHYLSLSDKKWRKCPICYESIYSKDLKSVIALATHQYTTGDTLTMKLMARAKGTTMALPQGEWSKRNKGLLTLEDTGVNQFAKLLSASPAQVLSLITAPERTQLQDQLSSIDRDTSSELCFVESALSQLDSRELALKREGGLATEDDELVEEPSVDKPPAAKIVLAESYFESHFVDPFSETEAESTNSTPTESSDPSSATDSTSQAVMEDSTEPTASQTSSSPVHIGCADQPGNGGRHSSPGEVIMSRSPQSSKADFDMVYFYQASDGQHLYIHPVNAKCLMKEYGSLEQSPSEIQATVVDKECLSMTEDIRSRYRYLNHLPLTCELALVELDLKPPLLSRGTLATFSSDLATRRQKRAKKKREEKRKEKKAESSQPEPGFIVPTSEHELTPELFHDFLSLASSPRGSGSAKADVLAQNDSSSTQSFAQALQGKPAPVWPVRTPPKPAASHYSAAGSVKSGQVQFDDSSVPNFRDTFNDALVTASASVMANQNVSGGKPGSKTAKKGRKKMVLFSTGSTRGTS